MLNFKDGHTPHYSMSSRKDVWYLAMTSYNRWLGISEGTWPFYKQARRPEIFSSLMDMRVSKSLGGKRWICSCITISKASHSLKFQSQNLKQRVGSCDDPENWKVVWINERKKNRLDFLHYFLKKVEEQHTYKHCSTLPGGPSHVSEWRRVEHLGTKAIVQKL